MYIMLTEKNPLVFYWLYAFNLFLHSPIIIFMLLTFQSKWPKSKNTNVLYNRNKTISWERIRIVWCELRGEQSLRFIRETPIKKVKKN